MKKAFLHHQLHDLGITKKRLFTGMFIFLSFSLVFYFLIQYFQLVAIALFGKIYQMPWGVSLKEARAINLFMAALAVVFGLSEALRYIFHLPRKTILKKNIRLHAIEADQRYLHYGFLSFFTRMSLFIVTFLGIGGYSYGLLQFGFYNDFRVLFYLIPLVLYLNSWINIVRIFKKKAIRWMGITLLVSLGLGYTLHTIGMKRTAEFREHSFTFNPILNAGIVTPRSFSSERESLRRLVISEPVIVKRTDSLELFIGSNPISRESLPHYLRSRSGVFPDFDTPFIKLKVAVDGRLKMADYYRFKELVSLKGFSFLALVVRSKNSRRESWQEMNNYVFDRLSPTFGEFPPPMDVSMLDQTNGESCIIDVHTQHNGMRINAEDIPKEEMIEHFKKFIQQNPDCLFRLHTAPELTVQDYVWVRSALNAAREELEQAYLDYHYPDDEYARWERDVQKELYDNCGFRLYVVDPGDYEPLFPKK